MFHPHKAICCYCNLSYKNLERVSVLQGGASSFLQPSYIFWLENQDFKMMKLIIFQMMLYLTFCCATYHEDKWYDDADAGDIDNFYGPDENYANNLDNTYVTKVHD